MSTIKRSLLGAIAVAFVGLCAQVPSALAVQPWWKLQVDSAPAILQPGKAADEVQELTVSATGGSFRINSPVRREFAWDVTHQELQEGLEEAYGKGNVEVPSGQGNETGSDPYRIVWKGDLADHTIQPLNISLGEELTGGREEATIRQVTKGRSDATLVLTAANLGDADLTGPVTVSATLPAGLTPVEIKGLGGLGESTHLECSTRNLSCIYNGITMPYGQVELFIAVNVSAAHTGEPVEFNVSGGNTRPANMARAMTVGNVSPSFGVEDYELTPEEEGGATATQAGSHPFQLTTTLMLNQRIFENGHFEQGGEYPPFLPEPAEMPKDLVFKLPPGLIGNPTPFPQCSVAQFDESYSDINGCANSTAIGVAAVSIQLGAGAKYVTTPVPLFNLTPSVGEPARFGFYVLGNPVFLDTSVRTGGDYGVTVKVTNVTQQAVFVVSRVTFWGVPGDPRHDNQRGWSCIDDGVYGRLVGSPCSLADDRFPPPLLELPTSCTGTLQTTMEADSWQNEGSFVSAVPNAPLPALDGCNKLPFNPSISVAPDGQAGSTPTGLTVGIHVPQEVSLNGEGLGEADVRNTTVALPEGVVLNPSAADGLSSCSEGEIGLPEDRVASCPEAAKVGTVKIKSPLLPNALEGAAYLAAQEANPFGSLVALYVVAEDPVSGTLIKLAGEVTLDQQTGQLISTFRNTPQLPFEDFELHFFGGDRAPLATPALCGPYTTSASIAPWSGNEPATPSSTFDVTSGPNGAPCHDPLPFAPSLTSGTTSIQAGGFSPFTMTMSRPDGSQNLQAVTLKMPPGLLGTLASVKLCPEAQANAGTCGPESLIGHTTVSVGVGGDPYTVNGGEVFITEGYKGAPYGLSIVNPAVAGPYNLGKVIVRAKIEVDPITSALTVTTDTSGPYKIPTILDGIPLQIQHINVSIDRSDFTFNPTNCSPSAITGSLQSSEGVTHTLSVPFQVTNCATLAFKPQFKVSTSGKTSRSQGASLDVKLTYPKAVWGTQANIKSVKVDLPRQLPSRLTTLQKACPNTVFEANPAACPVDSRVGSATATTPIIPVSLSGPAFFVSYGGAKFPELVIVLSGYGVTVDLHGETFISPAGITSSTFRAIPDVPIGGFELKLPEGKFSALGANKNLCTVKGGLKMPTAFTAQNGLTVKQSTPIGVTGCAKAKAKKVKKAHAGHKKK